jgi:mono/diheme cytochrome c family protein
MPNHFASLLLVCLTIALGACAGQRPASSPAQSAEAARGRVIAEERCATCHAIDNTTLDSPNLAATPFEVIAKTPGMTNIALNAWLHSAHPSMPNVPASQDETDDLWAYLLTLRDAD